LILDFVVLIGDFVGLLLGAFVLVVVLFLLICCGRFVIGNLVLLWTGLIVV